MLPKFQISNFKFQIISILFLLLSIFYLLPSVTPAYAASQTVQSTANSNTSNDLHNWTQTVMIETMSALTCQLAGVDPTNPKQACLGVDQKSGGAIGFMGNMIATLYTPPLHTSDYFQNLASNFGIGKKTYAQSAGGTGFQGLSPLIGIWSAFRNIVYLFLVIIFVVIGLAIMLRVKIDPRTVMTIQNQIPKVIIGILAVTFSFAIAGFLVDLMWILIYLIYNTISSVADVKDFNPINLLGKTPFGLLGFGKFFNIAGEVGTSVGQITGSLLGSNSGILGGIVGGILGTILGGIAFLVIAIALLFALFRLWFTLIMAYVQILIDVVLAPFWIIGGIVPGSPISISGWFRNIGANLLAFPVTIAMFMLGKVFMDAFTFSCDIKVQACKDAVAQNFVPPLVGNPGDQSTIGSLIGLGIILMTPNVVSMLKSALKAPKIDTGGVGKTIGAGIAPFKETASGTAAYYRKFPKAGEKEGFGGVIQRIFR